MAQNPQDNQRTMIYLLGVVIVLLVAIVVLVFVMKQPATPVAGTNNTTQAPASGSALPGVGSSQSGFDPATATKVPAGQEPKAYVALYYQNILDKKWDAAFKMQPATSQSGGNAQQFASTQQSYGMTSFKVLSSSTTGDQTTVVASQDLGTNGVWTATWTFQKSGSTWLVKQRAVAMGAPTTTP
jgi:hypothetical protein